MKKQRIIILIDMDAFFAKVEERVNPQFKGKPIVVGAEPKVRAAPEGGEPRPTGRGVVSTSNYEARKYGIKSGMPISWAWQRCPEAVFLPVNMELYQRVSERIMKIVERYSDIVEKVSVDEAYLDVSYSGTYKKAEEIARKLKSEILEKEGLPCTIGIGPNKLIAKIACEQFKPDGLLAIEPRQVQNFLDPLDIKELPGVGPKTAERLRKEGANKIVELRKLSEEKLKNIFGKVGGHIYQKAKGIDNESVVTEREIKSIGRSHTFERDTRDPEIIFKKFEEIINEVFEELKQYKFSFKTISVVCRFSGFETHTKDKTLERPSKEINILRQEAKRLLLKFIVENPKQIRLIGLRVKIC